MPTLDGTMNKGIEVLIVEDSQTQAEQLKYLLEEQGYAVATAANGRQAFAAARVRRPTIIISDILMPEMDGYALCKAIKSDDALKDIPVILVTDLNSPQDVVMGLQCCADNFITKPYEPQFLLARITQSLRNRKLRGNRGPQSEVEIDLAGHRYVITAERHQILDLLIPTYEEAVRLNQKLREQQKELAQQVQERTADNAALAKEIAERKRAEEAVRASEERFRSVTQSANVAIVSADNRGVILSWNKGATAIFGYAEAEVEGQPLTLLMPERYREAHLQGLKRVQAIGESRVIGTTVELHGLRKDGGEFPLELSLATWKTWGETFYSAIIRDITERKQVEARLAELAYYDFLTGLPNRRQFMELLDQALGRARRTGKLLSILFLDLDGFKLVNDSLGHPMGDLVLKTMATRLTGCVRKTDSVARMGGDEFMFILEKITSPNDASAVAQKLLETVALPLRLEGHDIFMTASIGIVIYPSDDQDRDGLIQYADTAMYVAKAKTNSFQFYSADMNVRAAERLQLETDLRLAVEREEFLPHYQPLIDAHSGNICGVEALVRWNHPHRGLLSPDSFISVAEETGLIVPITELVLRTACTQTKAWQVGGFPGLRVAANISRRLFQHHNLSGMIVQTLHETGLEPSSLEVELTESLFIQDRERSIATLRKLRDVGVRIAIDDFGVEYSSLGYLKHLPITTLKIDQSFVRDLPTNPAGAAIIHAIISLASSLDLTVIAEGVETDAQAEFLRSELCDELQGYYFSRPLPANLLTPLLGHSIFRPARSRITLGSPEEW